MSPLMNCWKNYRLRVTSLSFTLLSLLILLIFSSRGLKIAQAGNVPALQFFYITLPEEVMLQYLGEVFGATPVSPVRSVTSIAIGTYGTLVYYDQWEDGGYDTDIANPDFNYYHATTNPDGTQIWGDGVIANGCAPSINNISNPCATPADDFLDRGDVITLDNQVVVNGTLGSYSRNPAQIFFDGRDKVASSLPVAISRALWPAGAGSLVADAQGILPTERWGTNFISPVGENNNPGQGTYEDVRLVIMAQAGGATVNVDANADGDFVDTYDHFNYAMAEGSTLVVRGLAGTSPDGVLAGARVNVVSGNPVQVTLLTADVGSTYENRFYNLVPFNDWDSNYYTPVGTPAGATCTNVWVYNPNASAITINYDFPGGPSPDGTFNVPANSAAASPNILTGNGAHLYTTGGSPPVFLPISSTDCSVSGNGDIYDWGNELYPLKQLSPEILIGWSPGCTNESTAGTCLEVDGVPANTKSRSVVWVTALANTTLYVDLDGSGIACPAGTGAERTIAANALQSIQVADDPDNVRDQFDAVAYNNNGGGNYNANWASNWTETGDGTGVPTGGSIWITGGALQFRDNGATNLNDTIQRSVNLAGMSFARLSFRSTLAGLGATDDVVVEVSPTGGAPWTILATYTVNNAVATRVFDISPYTTANTAIRFRNAQEWEGGETWTIDNVNIDYSVGGRIGDFDMTGAYIRTCDDVQVAAAFGQNPSLSASGDNEAMDLGMAIPPYGSQIRITKNASETFVSPGGLVTYTYNVSLITTFSTAVNNVEVQDDMCSPTSYVSGDTVNLGFLDPGESWVFTCTTRLYEDTTNTAIALAYYGPDRIRSTPAQATVLITSSIGDYVWVDEDGDGDQDAGEPGIPNVLITLTGTDLNGNPVTRTTYTDSNGRYLFANVPPSNSGGYSITVDTTTLPPGLAANPTYDENGIGTPHTTTVVLESNLEYMTADFGYNWSSTTETNTNTGTGMIGDRVWIDANGNGLHDPGEPGMHNITVELLTAGPDGLFGTPDDVIAATTTTDYAGNYYFDGLAAGVYAIRIPSTPAGYTQTGDPDTPGIPCTLCDGMTTTPILLSPGDVYLNADFGFQPAAGNGATIGDTIWMDANRNDTVDTGEPGFPGVTVALIRDLNGNGIWDLGEPIIATDLTDANGQYAFTGVPVTDGVGTDDYLVWVNDTANVLAEMTAVYDSDGTNPASGVVTGLGISAVTDLTPTGDLNQDFAYAPAGHDAGEALVGDTIWLDQNGNGVFDPGEGLEGVVVNLLDTSGKIVARTRTNENGQYYFGGLGAGTYTVDVNLNSLPNYSTTLDNFFDPDGSRPHRTVVTLAASQIDLNQDLGYRNTTGFTIGGTLWNDVDTDGLLEGGEPNRFAGVTIALYTDSNDNGIFDPEDMLVGTTTTDANGNYSFTGLPNDRYFVDVTDEAGVLNGYWHSLGTAGADNNSQTDPYTIVLAGANNTTADFGYFRDPANVGDFVWLDRNNDGIQDPDEPGIPGVLVTLTVLYPNGATASYSVKTGPGGVFSFGNLLLDEDFNLGDTNPGTPTYTISFATPPATTPSPTGQGTPSNDSNGTTTVVTPITEGQTDTTYDSGFYTDRLDLGDLPSTYPTLFSPGPAHIIFPDTDADNLPNTAGGVPAVWLGLSIDLELNGQPGPNADGDGADEDGLTFALTGWIAGGTSSVDITINSDASATTVYYGLWIDWDDGAGGLPDGTFDAFYNGSGVSGSPAIIPVSINIPSTYTANNPVYLRLRASDSPLGFADYQGTLINGEVEDYRSGFTPTAITLNNLTARANAQTAILWLSLALLLSLSAFVVFKRSRPNKLEEVVIPHQD